MQHLLVLNRRNKRSEPCNPEWKSDDELSIQSMLKDATCTPPYIKLRNHSNYPRCTTREDLEHFHRLAMMATMKNQQRPPPCRQIEKATFGFEEFDWLVDNWIFGSDDDDKQNATKAMFEILFEFPDATYMEIDQTKAYETQTLIGNIGGYIGMFLGCR